MGSELELRMKLLVLLLLVDVSLLLLDQHEQFLDGLLLLSFLVNQAAPFNRARSPLPLFISSTRPW